MKDKEKENENDGYQGLRFKQIVAMLRREGRDDKNGRLHAIAELCETGDKRGGDCHREWQKFYQKVFGLNVDLSNVAIPQKQPGFGWVVIVAGGLVLNQVLAKCKERFPSYSYLSDDLDKAVPTNDRTAETAYAKRFRDRVEADEELKGLSANQLAERHVESITLLERLLLELWYFWKTDKHLDIQSVTLCAGSRGSDGFVPDVYWCSNRLEVYDDDPDDRDDDNLRARAAV